MGKCIAITSIVAVACYGGCNIYLSVATLKVIYHPLYGMNNYVFILGGLAIM